MAATDEAALNRRELSLALAVAVAVALIWWLIASANGAVGIARNDDWSYVQNAFQLAETHSVSLSGWVQMMLIGQLVLALPVMTAFGASVAALQGMVAILGVVALVSGYAVLRNFLPRSWAAIGVMTLAGSALFGLLSVSFMTDVPAAAFQLACLAIGYRATRGSEISLRWLVLACALGVVAFSIREYSIAALAAVLVVSWRKVRGTKDFRPLVVLVGITAIVVVSLFVWRSSQVTVTDSPLGLFPYGLRYLPWWPLTAAWLLLPVLASVNPLTSARRAWASSRSLTIIGFLGLVVALAHTRLGLLGNYVSLGGGYSEVLRGVPERVLPTWWSFTLVVASVYGAVLLVTIVVPVVVRTWTNRRGLLQRKGSKISLAATFLTATAVMYAAVPLLADVALFDRYFVAVLPIAAGLVVWWAKREGLFWPRPLAPAVVLLCISCITSAVLVAATSALDGARWTLGRQLAQDVEVAEGNVDAGFDFYNFKTDGVTDSDGIRWTWWTARLSDRAVCATVTYADFGDSPLAAGPNPNASPIAEVTVKSPLAREQRIVGYLGPDSC